MNKPIQLEQAISDIGKTPMHEFWYDYIKPMYGKKAKLNYMDTDSYITSMKTIDIYADMRNDVQKWFDTSSIGKNDNKPIASGVNKEVLGKFKFELGGKIISDFCGLKAKTY